MLLTYAALSIRANPGPPAAPRRAHDPDHPQELRKMDARQRSIVDMPPLAECRKPFEAFLGHNVERHSAEDDEPEIVARPRQDDGVPPY